MRKGQKISIEIRQNFLDFFKKQGHTLIPSSSLIPKNDPTLLFTNSGMVQFKDCFTGGVKPSHKNIVTIQKCIRAGGKHNDLENVGFTPRHHTFFEMLGNFSFGDYFKEEAVVFAWNFLTKILKIKKEKLIVTVFHEDVNCFKIWKKVSGLSDNRILKISSNDNFWSMGENGPCGPCSEIFFDNGEKIPGGLPGTREQDGPRFVEIWNLVFMEFEKNNGKLRKLPMKCVDTGMGLERITSVLSKTNNNFQTDLFLETFNKISQLTEVDYSTTLENSFRIVADHIRSIVFLMSEGILPSNEGRGYVLRRIIRRALLHLSKIRPNLLILNRLAESVIKNFSEFYPELTKSELFIKENLENEEEKFSTTLTTGINLLNAEILKLKNKIFPAEIAYKLHDTYGFPIDMTSHILKEKKILLNFEEYNKISTKNRLLQRETWAGSGEIKENKTFIGLKDLIPSSIFVGYEKSEVSTKLLSIISNKRKLKKISKNNENLILIFESTPFYAESGGQVGDTGTIFDTKRNLVANVINTTKVDGNIFLHLVSKNFFPLTTGNKYLLSIDKIRRKNISNNHSATHLLHESLRRIVGKQVAQKGSLVNDKKLRFDFSSSRPVNNTEISKIEKLVNESIRMNLTTHIKKQSTKEAISQGAIALFGEKYPEFARVVYIISVDTEILSSIELCGGTHVKNTGEIGFFKIISESSVASGIRRIEAVTGEYSSKFLDIKLQILSDAQGVLKATDENLIEKILTLKNELNSMKKIFNKSQINFSKENIIKHPKIRIYYQEVECESSELKKCCDELKKEFKSGIIILSAINNKKISVVVSITKDISKSYNAIKILQIIINFLDGKGGGGREDLAQGGANFTKKFHSLKKFIQKNLVF